MDDELTVSSVTGWRTNELCCVGLPRRRGGTGRMATSEERVVNLGRGALGSQALSSLPPKHPRAFHGQERLLS